MTTARISGSTLVVAAADQVSAELAGETIVLGLHDGTYYGLPGVGARIWQLVQEERTVAQIRDAVVEEFDVDPERCLRDLRRVLGEMVERGLVVATDPG